MEVTKILILRLNKPTCGAEGDSVSVGQWGDVQCMDKSIEPHLLMFEVRFTVLLCPEKPNALQHTRKQKNASKGHKRQQKWNKAFDLSRSHNHSHRWIKYSKHLLKNMSCSKELAELSWQWFLVTLSLLQQSDTGYPMVNSKLYCCKVEGFRDNSNSVKKCSCKIRVGLLTGEAHST